jgi:K(+)-stimulated pyrophosphate-energized sodium pump
MSTSSWFRKLIAIAPLALIALALVAPLPALAQEAAPHAGGEANLHLPDLGQATFFGGLGGRTILMGGIVVSILGLAFGLAIYTQLKNLPVHASMLEISELI